MSLWSPHRWSTSILSRQVNLPLWTFPSFPVISIPTSVFRYLTSRRTFFCLFFSNNLKAASLAWTVNVISLSASTDGSSSAKLAWPLSWNQRKGKIVILNQDSHESRVRWRWNLEKIFFLTVLVLNLKQDFAACHIFRHRKTETESV